VGVALLFMVISDHLHASPVLARDRLDRLRKLVEHYICETRQSIWDLRSPALDAADLASALKTAGEAITAAKAVRFEMTVKGKPFTSSPKIEEQLLRIGREAMSNAVRHAGPTRVTLDLTYEEDAIALRVADDGSGFDIDNPAFAADTHWGLASMRERAQQIHAELRLNSAPGRGTELTVAARGIESRSLWPASR
jgi:signal transduction histidine kinase